MRWQVPGGTPAFPRIYAVLDADNGMLEIHENNNVSWNILQKSTGTIIDEVREARNQPEFTEVYSYPNPFSGETRIRFMLPSECQVNIQVYNALGQQIATLADEPMTEGSHTRVFNAMNNPPGIYFCLIRAGASRQVIKMMLKE
jgi:hypothetical protein